MVVVVKERICRQCGAVFQGGPRAWYCPDCRAERQHDADARYRSKGRKADRPLGSIDHCTVCGNPYTVKAARQKYCPACAHDAVRAADQPMSRQWNQEHKDSYYPDKNAQRREARKQDPEKAREKDKIYRQRRKTRSKKQPPEE